MKVNSYVGKSAYEKTRQRRMSVGENIFGGGGLFRTLNQTFDVPVECKNNNILT